MSDAQDRTLPATPRKISKAREDGQVPRSRDLGHLAAIGVGTVLLIGLTPQLIERLRLSLRSGLRFDAQALVSNDGMLGLLLQQTTGLMLLVLPMGAATLLAALAAAAWHW